MSGYIGEEREEVPMSTETRVGSAVVLVGAAMVVLFTFVAVGAFPDMLGALHGKVSPAMPAMWLLGGTFIIRAGVDSPSERVSQRWLRIAGWGIVAMSGAVMILGAL